MKVGTKLTPSPHHCDWKAEGSHSRKHTGAPGPTPSRRRSSLLAKFCPPTVAPLDAAGGEDGVVGDVVRRVHPDQLLHLIQERERLQRPALRRAGPYYVPVVPRARGAVLAGPELVEELGAEVELLGLASARKQGGSAEEVRGPARRFVPLGLYSAQLGWSSFRGGAAGGVVVSCGSEEKRRGASQLRAHLYFNAPPTLLGV